MADKEQNDLIGAMVAAMALDRSRRRWRFWALAFLVILLVVAAGASSKKSSAGWLKKKTSHIAQITVEGLIIEDLHQQKALGDIAKNPQAKALIIYINSPGGTMVGGLELFKALYNVRTHKPVVAVMGSTAASAGYLVSLAGNHVIANEATTTGSIGVLAPLMDMTELAQKIGIKTNFITSGELKTAGMPLTPPTEKSQQYIQNIVDQLQEIFLSYVVRHRDITPETIALIKDGRAIIGKQAHELNLVDALGGMTEARQWLEKEHKIGQDVPVVPVTLEEKDSFLKHLATQSGTLWRFMEAYQPGQIWAVDRWQNLLKETLK